MSLDSKTNTLVVGGTGNGIEELEEEFNDGKIEFGYCRVVDENSQLPKTVFISWVFFFLLFSFFYIFQN